MIIIVMGVAGSGKTTIGALLAGRLGWTYAEADDFHPESNVDKMATGQPLTDAERRPWLEAIGQWIDEQRTAHQPGVVSCSALKRGYRDLLRAGRPEVRVVFLEGSRELIQRRMVARHGHFMQATMLDSQFAALEPPEPDEDVLTVGIEATPPQIVDTIVHELKVTGPGTA